MKLLGEKGGRPFSLRVEGHGHLKGVRKIIYSEVQSSGELSASVVMVEEIRTKTKRRGQGTFRKVPSSPGQLTACDRDTGRKCYSCALEKTGRKDDFKSMYSGRLNTVV